MIDRGRCGEHVRAPVNATASRRVSYSRWRKIQATWERLVLFWSRRFLRRRWAQSLRWSPRPKQWPYRLR